MRKLSNPPTEEDKAWMKSRNMDEELAALESEEPADEDMPEDYEDWKVDELKAELTKRQLPVSGSKAELIDRLAEDDESGE